MEEKEYQNKIDKLFIEMLETSQQFARLVKDYYDLHPDEVGNMDGDFYRRISRMADEFERCSARLHQNLKEPDSIQNYDTR